MNTPMSLFELCSRQVCTQVQNVGDIDKFEIPVTVKKYLNSICKNVWFNLKCDDIDNYDYSKIDFDNITRKDFLMLMNYPEKFEFKNYINQVIIRRFSYEDHSKTLCYECFSKLVVFKENFDIAKTGCTFIHRYSYGEELLRDIILSLDNWCDFCIFSPTFQITDLNTSCQYIPLSDLCDEEDCLSYLLIKKQLRSN